MSLSPAGIQFEQAHINDSIAYQLIAANAVCLTASLIAVGLRFFARYKAKAEIGADDWTVTIALVREALGGTPFPPC